MKPSNRLTPAPGILPERLPRRAFLLRAGLGLICGLGLGRDARQRVWGQSGRAGDAPVPYLSLTVIAQVPTPEAPPTRLTTTDLTLYDAGVEQVIESIEPDPSAATIVFLADNSATFQVEVGDMEQKARSLIRELFTGDRLMLVGYAKAPEILCDLTDDAAQLVAGAKLFRKSSAPRLYDALLAVTEDVFRPATTVSKRVIVLLSDGYDEGSQTSFEAALAALQSADVVVYAMQAQDRTYGAPRARRLGPKPAEALRLLTEGTGGRSFKLDEAQAAAVLTDEVRRRWFRLRYNPQAVNSTTARRLFLVAANDQVVLRAKKTQPPPSTILK
ncbi:VWA domain-containing protein [Chloracidobacterium aggregatum]|uniref:VWA domain-containing protein n=1 Tax=Chloracidobacterium sp. N TaxID=2821540 RepID=A0ABX8AXZ0_9BACT|nr:VWA domain-containing protein [Chloracidobacterium aggregatum]QUV84069.1 VWA domain-containing protein [Chloracidobacterium sp. 2]QUV87445.1 VWA domain-containing protein [Chloracidobacterium sp. S]QUV90347.1 VWA domain-containing protein [Chloracidobacterium sp. A]QUV93559.1 VWA domain-containing protein [Chloracidobacterium sp. N]QUV96715.1 VWA domain-containing protein [Chloracidobacterium sp. E]